MVGSWNVFSVLLRLCLWWLPLCNECSLFRAANTAMWTPPQIHEAMALCVPPTKLYWFILFIKWSIYLTMHETFHANRKVKVGETFYTHTHNNDKPTGALNLSFKNCVKLFSFYFLFGVLEALSLLLLSQEHVSSTFSCQVEERQWIKFELICRGVWKAFEKLLLITRLPNWVMKNKSPKTDVLSFW